MAPSASHIVEENVLLLKCIGAKPEFLNEPGYGVQNLYATEDCKTQQKSVPAPMADRREKISKLTADFSFLLRDLRDIFCFPSGCCTCAAVRQHYGGLPDFSDICSTFSIQICSLKRPCLFLFTHWLPKQAKKSKNAVFSRVSGRSKTGATPSGRTSQELESSTGQAVPFLTTAQAHSRLLVTKSIGSPRQAEVMNQVQHLMGSQREGSQRKHVKTATVWV